jgi:predicted N-acetyltransferase YhbS
VPPRDLLIRAAIPADAEQLAALVILREGGAMDAHTERFKDEARRIYAGDRRLLLVAELDGRAVGLARAVHRTGEGRPEGWYLAGLVVAKDRRGVGIEEALAARRAEWLRGQGAFEVMAYEGEREAGEGPPRRERLGTKTE